MRRLHSALTIAVVLASLAGHSWAEVLPQQWPEYYGIALNDAPLKEGASLALEMADGCEWVGTVTKVHAVSTDQLKVHGGWALDISARVCRGVGGQRNKFPARGFAELRSPVTKGDKVFATATR